MEKFSLGYVLNHIEEGDVYQVNFADTTWHMTKSAGVIWYCNKNGDVDENQTAYPLTYSNLEADYELIKQGGN